MKTSGSLPDLSAWVILHRDRPPRMLQLLFWGAMGITIVLQTLVILIEPTFASGPPALKAVMFASFGATIASCALWPLLAWSEDSPPLRRLASVVFLVLTILCLVTNNYTMFLLVCVGTMNAVAVFGLPGGFGYGASIFAFSVVLALALPGLAPLWAGLVMGTSLLFIVAASGMAFVGLVVASERAERTTALLSELERAHEELRHRAERVRELTVAEERARMSREMHDSTGHYLTALAMSLSNALRFRTARPDAAWGEVEQARELAGEALTDTRRWVRALRPLRLEGRAGVAAMRAMADSFDGGGIRIGFTDTGTWPELSEEAELVCYRGLQEGLTNAMRHSGADLVEVLVDAGPGGVSVTVADNGGGAAEGSAISGFGLRGLAERVEAVGGTLDVGDADGDAAVRGTPGTGVPVGAGGGDGEARAGAGAGVGAEGSSGGEQEGAPRRGFRLRVAVPARVPAPETALTTIGGAA
ncbi:sensor histidine kinase [Nocardiopsis sp. CT-R113]|uniref:histidine kinase n=1 Tax=Nocardiopsis codii TaxID=3065942 RepID=A0ABU7KAY7_9ACTN|nr:sensor histidine kinase [Nocardiopsis sp. CT-R113]MEE2039398.1 sensor histidine kinase [Nocardiopsis sp. CT-R113]